MNVEEILDEMPDCPFCGNSKLNLIGGELTKVMGIVVANVYCKECSAQAPQSTWKKRCSVEEKPCTQQS